LNPNIGTVGGPLDETTDDPNTDGNTPNQGKTADPVATGTGEYAFALPLLDAGGLLPIRFTLFYAANLDQRRAEYNDPFGGDNFTHSYHIALQRADDAVHVFMDGGNLIRFEQTDAGWGVVAEETPYQLQETAGSYFLLDPLRAWVYTFTKANVAGQSVGLLTHIEDRNGNALTFTNDSSGRVTRIEDGLGRALDFTYTNPSDAWDWPHLASVVDQGGRTLAFEYEVTTGAAPAIHLTGVSDPLGNTTTFSYFGDPPLNVVSGVTYPEGNTPYTQEYELAVDPSSDSEQIWRVASQTDAYGNTLTLSFDDANGAATITDPLGYVTGHTHADRARLTENADPTGAAASLDYDEAGRRSSVTDRLGACLSDLLAPFKDWA